MMITNLETMGQIMRQIIQIIKHKRRKRGIVKRVTVVMTVNIVLIKRKRKRESHIAAAVID